MSLKIAKSVKAESIFVSFATFSFPQATEAAEINNYLDAIRARLYNLEKVLIDRGLGATPQMLRDAYLDKLNCLKDWTLMTLIEVHMAELRSKIGKM